MASPVDSRMEIDPRSHPLRLPPIQGYYQHPPPGRRPSDLPQLAALRISASTSPLASPSRPASLSHPGTPRRDPQPFDPPIRYSHDASVRRHSQAMVDRLSFDGGKWQQQQQQHLQQHLQRHLQRQQHHLHQLPPISPRTGNVDSGPRTLPPLSEATRPAMLGRLPPPPLTLCGQHRPSGASPELNPVTAVPGSASSMSSMVSPRTLVLPPPAASVPSSGMSPHPFHDASSPGRTSPCSRGTPLPVASPQCHNIVTQNRNMLLAGMSSAHVQDLRRSFRQEGRRGSAPVAGLAARHGNARLQQFRERLLAWGQAHLGDAATADLFVRAVALRRSSSVSSSSSEMETDRPEGSAPATPGQITLRVLVRPQAPERRPYILTRRFDLDELRATIPDPSVRADPRRDHRVPRRQSHVAMLPLASPLSHRRVLSDYYRRGSADSARTERLSRRQNATKAIIRPRDALPIHLEYARSYLPVLAALMLSGHIKSGDTIEIPLPHPEAWRQTVVHVYTGQGGPSEQVRQNILYLAGKV